MIKFLWILTHLTSRLWFSASIYGFVAVSTVLMAIYLKRFIPLEWGEMIGAGSVDNILNILAASMLSVTIFSLSAMVSAFASATSNATPRAAKLLLEDKISHRAIATFLGSFIYSIVGIIALKTGVYGESGRLILFVVTIGVVAVIIVMLLRWIEYLMRLGQVGETIAKVEKATELAFKKRLDIPYLGGEAYSGKAPKNAVPVQAERTGYIQHIDMSCLAQIAEKHGVKIYVQALPGKFVSTHCEVVRVSKKLDEDTLRDIRYAFIMGDTRSFRQDPRFGFVVLNEIACRALSPGVNDPGTAIQTIGGVVRLFFLWEERSKAEVIYPHVYVKALGLEELFEDFFLPVSRDGAELLEVQMRLQKAYAAFVRSGEKSLEKLGKTYSDMALSQAKDALGSEYEISMLKDCMKSLKI